MTYIWIAALIVVGSGVLLTAACCLFAGAMDITDGDYGPGLAKAIPGLIVVVLGVAFLLHLAAEEEKQGPCLREETGYMMVNNVMTPYTYCVERGQWVEQ